MPQMAPLMWTLLFIFFSSLLLMVMIKISLSKKESQKNLLACSSTDSQIKLNWKW